MTNRTRRPRRLVVGLLAPVLTAGCVIFSSDNTNPQADLDANRVIWDGAAVTNYTMRFQRSCFCFDTDLLLPVRITVRDGVITEVFDLENERVLTSFQPGAYMSIDELFDFVQDAIDQGAIDIDVDYDNDLGFPTDIDVDFTRTSFSDEVGFDIRNLTVN